MFPKTVRSVLGLTSGDRFRVRIVEDEIVLKLVTASSPIDALYGKYGGYNLLHDLEQEHWQEVQGDELCRGCHRAIRCHSRHWRSRTRIAGWAYTDRKAASGPVDKVSKVNKEAPYVKSI